MPSRIGKQTIFWTDFAKNTSRLCNFLLLQNRKYSHSTVSALSDLCFHPERLNLPRNEQKTWKYSVNICSNLKVDMLDQTAHLPCVTYSPAKVLQVVPSSLSVTTYPLKYRRVRKALDIEFMDKRIPISLMNGSSLQEKILTLTKKHRSPVVLNILNPIGTYKMFLWHGFLSFHTSPSQKSPTQSATALGTLSKSSFKIWIHFPIQSTLCNSKSYFNIIGENKSCLRKVRGFGSKVRWVCTLSQLFYRLGTSFTQPTE